MAMVEFLLSQNFKYFLLGRYTSDHIEKLFGKWRQASDSNFFSVADVIITERIQWAKVTAMILCWPQTTKSSYFCYLCTADPSHILDEDFVELRGVSAYVAANNFSLCLPS